MAKDSPFKRPRRGVAPVPDEHPVKPIARVPDAAPLTRPSRPKPPEKSKDGKSTAPPDLWAFSFDDKVGAEGVATPFDAIELPAPKTLTVQFYQDTTVRSDPYTTPTPRPVLVEKEWGSQLYTPALGGGLDPENPGSERLSIDHPEDPTLTTKIRISVESVTGTLSFDDYPTAQTIVIEWDGGTSYVRCEFVAVVVHDDDPDWIEVTVSSVLSSHIETPYSEDAIPLVVRLEGPTPPDTINKPNASVRARVRYSAGKAEDIEFDCDWSGSLQLTASRVELSRVTFKPDPESPYVAQRVKVSAIARVNGASPIALPTLTLPTRPIPNDGDVQTVFEVAPPLARRASVFIRYGDGGAPGDAALGQFFVAFIAADDVSLAYIDFMSAREALFGAGLPIPAGTRVVALSNLSDDHSVRMGLVWHLGV